MTENEVKKRQSIYDRAQKEVDQANARLRKAWRRVNEARTALHRDKARKAKKR